MSDIEQVSTPEQEMAQINSLVAQLKEWETKNPPNEKVTRALEITHQIIDGPYQRLLNGRNVLITYHGSLLYNDPRQLDLDLVFTTDEEEKLDGVQMLIWQLEGNFERVEGWPESGENGGMCDTNFSSFTMEKLKEEVLWHEQEGIPYDSEEDISPLMASFLLTSPSLYSDEKQSELLKTYKDEAMKLLTQSHFLREAVIKDLEMVISVREERSLQKE